MSNKNWHQYRNIWNKHHSEDPILPGDGYCIHHIDRNHSNDDPNNLIKLSISEHRSLHKKGKNHHLYGKTHSKEAKEKIGRSSRERQKGENNSNSKLTQMTINWIRDILDSEEYWNAKSKGLISQTKLAELFGVTSGTISLIKNNKIWIIGKYNG